MLRVEVGLWSPNRGSGWEKVIEGLINKQKAQRVWAKGERHLVNGTDAEGEEAQDQRGEACPGV